MSDASQLPQLPHDPNPTPIGFVPTKIGPAPPFHLHTMPHLIGMAVVGVVSLPACVVCAQPAHPRAKVCWFEWFAIMTWPEQRRLAASFRNMIATSEQREALQAQVLERLKARAAKAPRN